MSLFESKFAIMKSMNSFLLSLVVCKVVGQIGISSYGRVIVLGEGKIHDSKPEKCSSGKSVAH